MSLSGQQWVFKNITIISATTGVVAGGTNLVFVGCTFKNVETGINANGISGSLTLIDSTGSNLGSLITSYDSGNAGNSIVLENVVNSGNTVTLGSSVVKSGSVTGTWVHGNYVSKINSCQILYLMTNVPVCFGECQCAARGGPFYNYSTISSSGIKWKLLHHATSDLPGLFDISIYQHQECFSVSSLWRWSYG